MTQNIQSLGASGLYGTYTTAGGGGGAFARSDLDAARLGVGRTPQAEYPDGYLGNVKSRREDRLLDSLKTRQNERSYSRGVHKGVLINPRDYFWPRELQPDRGLRNQAKGIHTAPVMAMTPAPRLVNDGKSDPPQTLPGQINPVRATGMQHLRPGWR